MARQHLGQHFLADAGWRERITNALRASAADVWLEIGAGHGEMTAVLARRSAKVIAVEMDLRLLERLLGLAQELPNVEVIRGDVLALDLGRVIGPRRVRVYGNLPYYITSPILHRLFEHADRLSTIDVVVQLEVAERLRARPGRREYGYLSVLAQFYAQPEILLRIPPGAFRPRPKVTSALVSLRIPGNRGQLGITDEAEFLEFVKACFAQKRKTLLNNLRRMVGEERAQEVLRRAGLRRTARAEQLNLAELAALYKHRRQGSVD
ncbi:MAG TPA: 16S rRNA (adenine(1518)-N(6)/adenine(1519)-N(6))-dimethyltransferase RsmA [Candidatus Acidoferrales bacterium]|nr:16S rRNA (adenine(1518)-N(6)/adenine(1519)-N(6))-dimethyltransferase RsmA [Candidatus Acidoferrales bacterium]